MSPIFFLPLTIAFVLLLRISLALLSLSRSRPSSARRASDFSQRTVLLTGASTPAALALARAFHAAGHAVVAADAEPFPFASPARVCRSVAKFYRLSPAPTKRGREGTTTRYEHDVLSVILREEPALWIPCDVVSRVQPDDCDMPLLRDMLEQEARRPKPRVTCVVVAPDQEVLSMVGDEVRFAEFVQELESDVCAPECVVVRRRAEMHRILHASRGTKRFVAQKLDADVFGAKGSVTAAHLSLYDEDRERSEKVLLPRPTMNESYDCIAGLDVSKTSPWKLQEVIEGEECTAHFLVVDCEVKRLVLSQLSQPVSSSTVSVDDGSRTLMPPSALRISLQAFLQAFAAALPRRSTTHLSINLVVSTKPTPTGTITRIHPTSCSATVPLAPLFHSTTPHDLTAPYLSATASRPAIIGHATGNGDKKALRADKTATPPNGTFAASAALPIATLALPTPPSSPLHSSVSSYQSHFTPSTLQQERHSPVDTSSAFVPDGAPKGTYSLPRSAHVHVLLPLVALLRRPSWVALRAPIEGSLVLADRLLNWDEELWDLADPAPWVWEWGVRSPVAGLIRVWNNVVGR